MHGGGLHIFRAMARSVVAGHGLGQRVRQPPFGANPPAEFRMDGASKKIKFKENGESGSNYIIRVVKDGKFVNYWDPRTGKKY